MNRNTYLLLLGFALAACSTESSDTPAGTETVTPEKSVPGLNYSIVQTFPHDTNSFTEGLLVHNGHLYESTGATEGLPYTRSLFGILNLKTGKIDKKAELDRETYFGEGIVFLKNKVYQLTYKNQIGFIYEANTFQKLGQFSYRNKEGWGLTTDGTYLIMSDGTDTLTYLDPQHLKPVKTLVVSNNGFAEDNLNELEYIKGYIYANIWTKNYLVKIDPKTGNVLGLLDLSSLYYQVRKKHAHSMEMNGIAWDSVSDKIYVTGKLWPEVFQFDFPH
jgi:glutamine cyclotransferase